MFQIVPISLFFDDLAVIFCVNLGRCCVVRFLVLDTTPNGFLLFSYLEYYWKETLPDVFADLENTNCIEMML